MGSEHAVEADQVQARNAASDQLVATSCNVLPGLRVRGSTQNGDTVATTRLDISKGSLP